MYYDTYRRGKKRSRRRRGCLGGLIALCFKLIAFALVLSLIALAGLYALPPSFLNVEPTGSQLSPQGGLPGSPVNILLLGLDFLNENAQRSDSVIVASVGYSSLKLTSIMRDTIVDIPGHGRDKLNSAFAHGGANLAMRTINENFGLNITNYVAVDFSAMVDLVDAVGGIDLEITDAELGPMNNGARDVCRKILRADYEKYKRYATAQPMTESGNLHLNGIFATGFCRVRSVDSDYMRTNRQRRVLSAIIGKVRDGFYNPMMYASFYKVLKSSVRTNLSLWEIISLGEKILVSGRIETCRAPQDDFIRDDGSKIEITDLPGAGKAIRDFIYHK